ncbi:MAG: DUF3137 domain-containing protein [Clostridia bacterium]|nr:DUF3137 domain-containing protein [Clostridia bacterium]
METVRMSSEELENRLKPYVRTINLCNVLGYAAGAVILLGVILLIAHIVPTAVGVLIIAIGIILTVILQSVTASNRAKYNKLVMEQRGADIEEAVSSCFGPDQESETNPDALAGRVEENIKECGLLDQWKRCTINSHRKGIHNSMAFETFNAILEAEVKHYGTGSEGEPEVTISLEPIFNGSFIVCEIDRATYGSIIIRKIADQKKRSEFANYHTSDSSFDALFDVYAADPTEAACLIPELIGSIKALDEITSCNLSGISMQGQTLTLAMNREKFMNMQGANTLHVDDLLNNLKTSLAHTTAILDIIHDMKAQLR